MMLTALGASSVLYAFWGIAFYPATDAATVSARSFPCSAMRRLISILQGFRKGTITMIVVSVALAFWVCVVWWQDKRTERMVAVQYDAEAKLDDAQEVHELAVSKDGKKGED
jgi:hypothetical protein